MRDCMREAGSRQLKQEGRPHALAAFRAKDAATAQAMYHVACDMLRDCCPKAAVVAEEAEPTRSPYPGIPAFALEAPAHEQRAGARQPRDKAPQPRRAGVPVGGVVGTPGRGRDVRAGRDLVGIALLRAQTRCRSSTTKGAPRRPLAPEKSAAELMEEARKMILASLEVCGKGRGGVAYPARFQVKARAKAPPCLEWPFARAAFLGLLLAWNGSHQHPRHYLGSETWDS